MVYGVSSCPVQISGLDDVCSGYFSKRGDVCLADKTRIDDSKILTDPLVVGLS